MLASLSARVLDVGQQGGEPTIGATSDGAIFVTGGGPRLRHAAVTPDDDLVPIGCIRLSGGVNECRNRATSWRSPSATGGRTSSSRTAAGKRAKDADSRRSDPRVAVVDLGSDLLGGGALAPYFT